MLREWKTEWMKLKRRKAGLLVLAFLGFTFLWIGWVVSDADAADLADGYRWMFSNLSMINTILLPTMLAMLASRLCDMEIKGNTLKLLCTLEKKGTLFDVKLLTGGSFLILYVAAELLLLLAVITGGLWRYFTLSSMPDLEDSAIAYQMPNGLKNEDPNQIMIPGISGFTMEEGDTRIAHVLYNPEGNPCYFKYRVMLRDTQEVLYESGLVKPGTAIMEFDLNRTLELGSYDVTVLVETTSVEDPEAEMNRGAVNTTITVE